jgi:uncharacterized protein (DUF58 family)
VITDTGRPGRSSREFAVRGATGVAQTALRAHDQVGLVAVSRFWREPRLADVHDATLATLLIGLATTSALLLLIVVREALR